MPSLAFRPLAYGVESPPADTAPAGLFRFALVDPGQPFADPEFVGHPFEIQRRHWGQVRASMIAALECANGRLVVMLPWQQEGRAA